MILIRTPPRRQGRKARQPTPQTPPVAESRFFAGDRKHACCLLLLPYPPVHPHIRDLNSNQVADRLQNGRGNVQKSRIGLRDSASKGRGTDRCENLSATSPRPSRPWS